jgi:hypothetical protein
MAILQSLLALISRSAGKILNAVFGWAVRALFGRASETQRTLLRWRPPNAVTNRKRTSARGTGRS